MFAHFVNMLLTSFARGMQCIATICIHLCQISVIVSVVEFILEVDGAYSESCYKLSILLHFCVKLFSTAIYKCLYKLSCQLNIKNKYLNHVSKVIES